MPRKTQAHASGQMANTLEYQMQIRSGGAPGSGYAPRPQQLSDPFQSHSPGASQTKRGSQESNGAASAPIFGRTMPPAGNKFGAAPAAAATAGPMTAVSATPADYRKFILYIVNGDPNSNRAVLLASGLADVHIQNVRSIPALQRPAWLEHVPSLLSLSDNKCFVGTYCIEKLHQISSERSGAPMEIQNAVKDPSSDPLFYSAGSKSKFGVFVPDIGHEDHRYKSGSKISESDLEKYQRLRSTSGVYRPHATRTLDSDVLSLSANGKAAMYDDDEYEGY